jgi:DNA-binding transcriptional regulator YdaS (Cro superfamily)
MLSINENNIRKAVYAIGGVTKASNLIGVSNGAVHSWIKANRISNIDLARKLADLAGVPLTHIRPV